jgi:two-component system sensor histidine kinase RegB
MSLFQSVLPETRAIKRQSLAVLRWAVLAAQAITVLVVQEFLAIALPLATLLPLWLGGIAINLFFSLRRQALREDELLMHLAADSALLAAILHFTGGLQNPFAAILLIYPTIAAALCSRRGAVMMGGFTITALTILAFYHQALPWRDGQGLLLDRLYSCGVWTALMLGAMFIITVVQRLLDEARHAQQALHAAQAALARQQRIAALGGLAADAAHQLSTPLSTMTLIAHELLDDVNLGEQGRHNAGALLQQAQRCKTVLANLALRAQGAPQPTSAMLPLPLWWAEIVAQLPNRRAEIQLNVDYGNDMPSSLLVPAANEAAQAIGQILQNAFLQAQQQVSVEIDAAGGDLEIAVFDDGKGFAPAQLAMLGQTPQPISAHGGMGMGLFIARALLEQIGGELTLANAALGGAVARVRWPLRHLETEAA